MAKMTIEITRQIELIYDENSNEFKEALESYRDLIEKGANKESMLKLVASYVMRFGTDGMIEGVGYVGFNGRRPTEEPYSGIMVGKGYDDFDFDVW